MGIPGRLSEVSDTGPLRDFLDRLPESGRVQDGTNRVAVDRIHEKLRKLLPDAIHQEFSRADLSRKLCAELFDRMGYSYELQKGLPRRVRTSSSPSVIVSCLRNSGLGCRFFPTRTRSTNARLKRS